MKKLAFTVFFTLATAGCVATQQPVEVFSFHPARQTDVQTTKMRVVGKSSSKQSDVAITSGKEALHALTEGNERFVTGKLWHPNQSSERRTGLTETQKPHTIVLSCSDSRVPPEVVFDQGLGDLFVVRTAGEVADPVAMASIEYAVEHLGAKLLLVMGHESCGAVKATLSTKRGTSAGSKDLDQLVAAIRPHLKDVTLANAGPNLHHAVQLQVSGVLSGLVKRSKIIREAVNQNHLEVKSAIYHLDTGEAEILE